MSRFLRFCAFLSILFFTGNLMAAGYTCNTTPTYTSCKEGYYLEACGTEESDWSGQTATPVTGKTCLECPDGYVCEGGQKCPVWDGINCAAGKYIKANTTTCTACPSGSYCPGITTDSATSTSSDRGITQCPEGSYCPARSSSPKSCPTNYGNSAVGSDAQSDCYTSCGAGAVVTVPKTACTTPAGAWYSAMAHVVYYGSISPITYCPLGSDSHDGVTSLHDQVADCLVTVPAGYSSTVTTSTARYIRISSETGAFPLAEIQAYNSATQLSLALGSSVTNGANALDGSLTTQAIVSTESGVGAYATFDLGSANMITNIKFALGNVTSGYNIVIAISSDNSNWTTVFNQTVYGVSALPGVLQNVPLNTRTNTKCAAGTYHGATTVPATNDVTCTACPTATDHKLTSYSNLADAAYVYSSENLKFTSVRLLDWDSLKGGASIESCVVSYNYTNSRGHFTLEAVRYNSSTGKYDTGGNLYYMRPNAGYYLTTKYLDTYCDVSTRSMLYRDAQPCPAGSYCGGRTDVTSCGSGTYGDTLGIDGLVSVGYYSTGGGTSATPTASGNGCIAGQKCGTVAAGYYSSAGAKSETGDGAVYAGYWNDGCGINATGGVCDTTHKGGPVNAGYWNDGCGINATGGVCNTSHKGGLVNAGYWNDGCGINATAGVCNTTHKGGQVNAGYYNLGGGTSPTPEVRGKGCANVSTTQCGTVAPGYWGTVGATQYGGSGAVAPGYYSTGGATSRTPSASDCAGKVAIIENGKLMGASDVNNTCGQVQAGYWNNACGINATGGVCSTSYQGGIIAAGYWGTVGATDSVGSGLLTPGYYSTGGATSEYPDPNQCVGNNTCGAVAAGYWNNGGGTSANGTCVSGKSCGTVNGGYYSTGGGTSATPTAPDNGCLANKFCGQVNAGYYSTGGGTSATPTAAGNGCLANKSCGLIDAGYYGNAGATSSTGAGEVNGGFFSTGGGKTATPASNSDCAGDGTTCGKIAAGYWSYRGGKTATPTSSADCTMGYCGVIRGGYYSTCGGIEEYATEGSVNSCADGCECGPINPGYYSTGCSVSDDGAVCDTSKYTVGEIVAGYYSDGGSNTPQGDGLLAAGYFSTGGATVRKPTSADCVGSNTCGTVNAGYYVSGGGTLAAPVAFGNGCVGQWKNNAGEMVNHACGKVDAGYWNNGGGTDVDGTCVSGKSCGLISAGYYGNAGATSSTGAGTVWPGHFSTGGATKQKPTAADCVGDNTCGLVAAGYWTSHGGKTATPTTPETDCVNKACGKVAAGYFSTGGATRNNPTEVGNHCFGTSCGLLGAGYYSSGGGTSATPVAAGNGCLAGFVCGACPTGYDDNTAQGKTAVNQCQISCGAGTRVAAINAACTSPAGGWFSAAHLVNYGQISPVNYCMSGYTSASTSASGHDAATDCVQTIAGGKYVPSSKINARYIKITSDGSVSVSGSTNPSTHLLEMQAFASSDGTGTNLLSGKGAVAGDKMSAVTNGNWTRGDGYSYGEGSPMILDLGSVQALGSLKFAMYTDGREYQNVAIAVSEDNTTYTTVFTATKLLTQNTTTPTGELVVLSAVPKSCALGTYKVSGSLALTNTSSCDAAQAGYFVGTTGASSQTKCVMGSYTDTTGQSACKACAGGKTNSADGATSCTATCSNATGVAGWETPVWGTDNKMTNLCTIKATAGCSAKYYKNSNACLMCPDGYQDGGAGYTQISQCTMNVAGGKYVAAANESSASGTCEQGYAKAAHTVTYGETSTCDPCKGATYAAQEGMDKCETCPTVSGASGYGYWNTNGEAGNHTVRAGCQASFKNASIADGNLTMYSCYVDASADTYGVKGDGKGCWVNKPDLTCNGGYYNKTFNDSTSATQDFTYKTSSDLLANVCRDVESGYWSGADSLTRTACEPGLVTCGAGLCANEAGDCGRKLHAGDNVIYLRSEKRTGVSPLLHLKVGDKMFYGNMSTSLSSPLKVKYNNTKYSVVNDNQ